MNPNSDFTHFDSHGNARMVDVGAKPPTERIAVARTSVCMAEETATLIQQQALYKGDVLQVARLAAIMAAKRTDELIPLCHSLNVSSTEVELEFVEPGILQITTRVKTNGPTGVEMEALVAASTAALTVYDMCKAVDRGMTIRELMLLEKRGGKSGDWIREEVTVRPAKSN
ncbi:MAG: cyclic pyranopterin monophosphate synthase MoaC [Planctomycetaceae bacterium]|nr:cyclic pyranopterin monophosphate synthase MoaC [Planctomycetaceae bacterium]